MGSDLVVTSAVSVENCIYRVGNAHCHVKYQIKPHTHNTDSTTTPLAAPRNEYPEK